MRTIVRALVLLVVTRAAAVGADVRCEGVLTSGQRQALSLARSLENSYEVFTREVGGRTKVLALVGEPTHLFTLNGDVGDALDENFDATGMVFRRKMDLEDKLFEWLAAPVLKALFRMHAYFDPEDRAESEALLEKVLPFVRNVKRAVPLSRARKPFTRHPELFNNPFYEVRADDVYELSRMDLPERLSERHARDEPLGTINLEHGFKANRYDWMRQNIVTVNAGLLALLTGTLIDLPDALKAYAGLAGIIVVAWQAAGVALHGYNARAWFPQVFPFLYVGDDRRNAVAAPNIVAALRSAELNNMVVVIERRRVADLRERLIAAGFRSLGGEEVDEF